jgi:hypothetical protein
MKTMYFRHRPNLNTGKVYKAVVEEVENGVVYRVVLQSFRNHMTDEPETDDVRWITHRDIAIETAVEFIRVTVGFGNEKEKQG